MNLTKAIDWLKAKWSNHPHDDMETKMEFMITVTTTRVFQKLSTEDQLLSVGRMIMIFRTDFGFTPRGLEKKMESLYCKLKNGQIKQWEKNFVA
jgi:hypothetical protein